MTELILHHYSLSPFSQKIRTMLGYAEVPWVSCITQEAPPRPKLDPLTGGYRKIPVAQIGADIFCDTRVITDEIVRLSGKDNLRVDALSDEAKQWVRRADAEVFFACVLSANGWRLTMRVLRHFSFSELKHFLKDRQAMGKQSAVRLPKPAQAKSTAISFLADVESQLSDRFLFGDEPNLADFSVYHNVWFMHYLGAKSFVKKFPKVIAWYDRMHSFYRDPVKTISGDDAIAQANTSAPRSLTTLEVPHELQGQQVVVAPNDYGQAPSSGMLVGGGHARWIIERAGPSGKPVHVHFPQEDFDLRKV